MEILKNIAAVSSLIEIGEVNSTHIEAEEFNILYEQYYKRLYNYVAYRVCNRQMTEDITSQIFERILVKFNTFDKNKSNLDVWIFTIARNIINDHFRKQKFRLALPLDELLEISSDRSLPDLTFLSNETNIMLFKALQKLSDKERQIIAMKYGSELKNVEIAKAMNLKESNVGVILHRAYKKLKKELEKGGYFFYE